MYSINIWSNYQIITALKKNGKTANHTSSQKDEDSEKVRKMVKLKMKNYQAFLDLLFRFLKRHTNWTSFEFHDLFIVPDFAF